MRNITQEKNTTSTKNISIHEKLHADFKANYVWNKYGLRALGINTLSEYIEKCIKIITQCNQKQPSTVRFEAHVNSTRTAKIKGKFITTQTNIALYDKWEKRHTKIAILHFSDAESRLICDTCKHNSCIHIGYIHGTRLLIPYNHLLDKQMDYVT